jgi:hypothetical protein
MTSWEDLISMRKSGDFTVSTGGLGNKIIPGVYDTWACVKGNKQWLDRCAQDAGASRDDHYCFAFLDTGNNIDGIFVPWGSNKDLRLVKPKCTSA